MNKAKTNLAAAAIVALSDARVTSSYDSEAGHTQADNTLEKFVRDLGFSDVAYAYAAVQPKHCA